MQVSVLSSEQVSNLLSSGMPSTEIPIMEDLVRMLLPHSREIDVFEEAWHRYKQIKRKQRIEAARKQAEYIKVKQRADNIAAHGYIESMANGKIYSSKSAYLADARAMGYIDIGNEDMVAIAAKQRKQKQAEYEKHQEQHVNAILEKLI